MTPVEHGVKNSTTRPGTRWLTGLLVLACAGLSVEVVLLARKNRELRAQINRVEIQRTPARVEAGEIVPPFLLVDEFGDKIEVSFDHQAPRSFLLFFATGCDACEHIYPIWNDLFSETESATWRVLPIRVDEPGDIPSAKDGQLNLAVFTLPDDAPNVLLKVTSVPTTLMLDANGRVEKAWTGILSDETAEELRSAMAIESGP